MPETDEFTRTVVAVFIRDRKLLMELRDESRRVYPGFLMCPSGHVKESEPLEQAMKRELVEELGVKVKELEFLFSIEDIDPVSNEKFCHNFFLIKSFLGKIAASSEARTLVWMNYAELKKQDLVLIVERLVERLHEMNLL